MTKEHAPQLSENKTSVDRRTAILTGLGLLIGATGIAELTTGVVSGTFESLSTEKQKNSAEELQHELRWGLMSRVNHIPDTDNQNPDSLIYKYKTFSIEAYRKAIESTQQAQSNERNLNDRFALTTITSGQENDGIDSGYIDHMPPSKVTIEEDVLHLNGGVGNVAAAHPITAEEPAQAHVYMIPLKFKYDKITTSAFAPLFFTDFRAQLVTDIKKTQPVSEAVINRLNANESEQLVKPGAEVQGFEIRNTDGSIAFKRLNSVVNTALAQLFIKNIDFKSSFVDHELNQTFINTREHKLGTEVLIPLLEQAHVTPEELYDDYYTKSYIDGLAARLGELFLTDEESKIQDIAIKRTKAITKGLDILMAIETADEQIMNQYHILPGPQTVTPLQK
jgi:hypothetical protein